MFNVGYEEIYSSINKAGYFLIGIILLSFQPAPGYYGRL